MQKPLKIGYALLWGNDLDDNQLLALCEGERRKIAARVEAVRMEYDVPPEIVIGIESKRLVNSYVFN